MSNEDKITEALGIAMRFGRVEGAHHKAWVIDQMVRALAGLQYAHFISTATYGADGEDSFVWEIGIAP